MRYLCQILYVGKHEAPMPAESFECDSHVSAYIKHLYRRHINKRMQNEPHLARMLKNKQWYSDIVQLD